MIDFDTTVNGQEGVGDSDEDAAVVAIDNAPTTLSVQAREPLPFLQVLYFLSFQGFSHVRVIDRFF